MIINNKDYKHLVSVIKSAYTKRTDNIVGFLYENEGQIYVASSSNPDVIVRLGKCETPLLAKIYSIGATFFDTSSLVKKEDVELIVVNNEDGASTIQLLCSGNVMMFLSQTDVKTYCNLKLRKQLSIFSYNMLFDTRTFLSEIKKHKIFLPHKKDSIPEEYRSICFMQKGEIFEVQTLDGANGLTSELPVLEVGNSKDICFTLSADTIKTVEKFDSPNTRFYITEEGFCLNSDKTTVYLDKGVKHNLIISDKIASHVSKENFFCKLPLNTKKFVDEIKSLQEATKETESRFFILKKLGGSWHIRNAMGTPEVRKDISHVVSNEFGKDGDFIGLPFDIQEVLSIYNKGEFFIVCDDFKEFGILIIYEDSESNDKTVTMGMQMRHYVDADTVDNNNLDKWGDL